MEVNQTRRFLKLLRANSCHNALKVIVATFLWVVNGTYSIAGENKLRETSAVFTILRNDSLSLFPSSYFIELIGSAPMVSVNLEWNVYRKDKTMMYLRLGGIGSEVKFTGDYNSVLGIGCTYGKKHAVETGTTVGIVYNNDHEARRDLASGLSVGYLPPPMWRVLPGFILGYRYTSKGGFLLRVSATPRFDHAGGGIVPYIGLSIGYTRRK